MCWECGKASMLQAGLFARSYSHVSAPAPPAASVRSSTPVPRQTLAKRIRRSTCVRRLVPLDGRGPDQLTSAIHLPCRPNSRPPLPPGRPWRGPAAPEPVALTVPAARPWTREASSPARPAAAAAASALSPGLRSAAASVEVLTSTTHDVADQSRRAVCLSGHGCAFHSVDDRLFAQERFRFLRRLSGAPGREPSVTAHLILRPGDPLPLGALLYLVALVDALLLRRLSFLGTWNAEGTQGSRPGTSESSSPCL